MDGISKVIIIFGLFVGGVLFGCLARMWALLREFESKCIEKQSDSKTDISNDGKIGKNSTVSVIYKEVELEDHRDKYEKTYALYSAFSQIISLFPLIGIFGTVWGLYNSDLKDVDSLVQGLNLALTTTIYGLVASIGLKVVDAIIVWIINLINSKFDKADVFISRNDMKRELALAKEELKKED